MPAAEVHPLTVAVTKYVPEAAVVAPTIVGFWTLDPKALGPVHAYAAPAIVDAARFKFPPEHRGPLLVATGAVGAVGLVREMDTDAFDVQPAAVTLIDA
jgi:hypothetical protein